MSFRIRVIPEPEGFGNSKYSYTAFPVTMDVLRLTRPQLDKITTHARACKPEEACGILAGKLDSDGARVVEKVFLMENFRHSRTFYQMDSQEQFQVFDEMQRLGLEPVAIFHSHPHSPAYPSGVDLDLAFYPDSLYLIVSLAGVAPDSHVFRIVDGKIEVATLDVVVERTGADEPGARH